MNLNEVARELLSGKNKIQQEESAIKKVFDNNYNDSSYENNNLQRVSVASTLDLPFIKKPVRIKEPRNKRTSNFDAVLATHYKNN